MKVIYDDGGRSESGFKGNAGDCVTRAIAIVTGKSYKEVYDALWDGINDFAHGKSKEAKLASRGEGKLGTTPRNGVYKKVYDKYLKSIGMKWVPTMHIGSGCKVHLKEDELPSGKIICRLSRHLTAVIDGVIHDTYDPQRGGIVTLYGKNHEEIFSKEIPERCVYGYYTF